MKIQVPLSPFGESPFLSTKSAVYKENIVEKEVKRLSFHREKSPEKLRKPLLDLVGTNGISTVHKFDDREAVNGTNDPIKLIINVNDISQSAIDAATEPLRRTIGILEHQCRQIEYELADERSQHDEIAASLRRDCASLRDALRDVEARALSNIITTIPTPESTADSLLVQQLQEKLYRSKHAENALQSTVQRLKQTIKEKEQEHASLMEYLALEKHLEQQENDQMKGLIQEMEQTVQKSHLKAQEWQDIALQYEQDRQKAAENVNKAEQEVDLLAEENTRMARQLKYVHNKVSAYLATIDHAAPALLRLVREIDTSLLGDGSAAPAAHAAVPVTTSSGTTSTMSLPTASFLPSTIFNKMTPKTASKTPLTALRRPLKHRNHATMTEMRSSSYY